MNHNWEYKKLGDVCDVNYGTRIVAKNTPPGPYSVYGGGGATFTTLNYNREDCTIVSRFAMSKECVRFVSGRFFLNDSGLSVTVKTNKILQQFLDKYLWAIQPQIFELGRGCAQKNLNTKAFSNLPIPVPGLDVQDRIVTELDEINALIDKNKKLIETLNLLAQSLFFDMFGDPIANPKCWEKKKLGEVSKLSAGGDKPRDTEKTASLDKNIPVYSNGIENEGLYGYTSTARISDPSLTISGRGTIGVPFIRKKPFVPIIRLIVVIPNQNLNLNYLYFLVRALKLGGTGAAIPQLTVPMVKDISIPVPPLALQEEFARRVEEIEAEKGRIEVLIGELQTLLDSRMDYWFN